ncbi:MAG: NAD(P)-binding domain-containing protein [Flavobacteriaceae bacterium]|nr:NAD(P)-binding domain-containing protein [Flavobacteriaceae bacterium]
MKLLIYSAKDFEIPFIQEANKNNHDITFIEERLTSKSAMKSLGYDGISIFSADDASSLVLEKLKDFGVKFISLRSTGYDNINLFMARKLGIKVGHVPKYSPNAIAEHAVALLMALNRKLLISHQQLKDYNFLLGNLMGFDVHEKTVGILGTGRIGSVITQIMHGFGCELIAHDLELSKDLARNFGVQYKSLNELVKQSDVLFISVPLNSETHHLIDWELLSIAKPNLVIVNIARGAIVITKDVIRAIETKRIKGYAADVYEKEHGIFFYDHSEKESLKDPILQELIDHPKIVLTPHQAFVTEEAIAKIAETTLYNFNRWEIGQDSENELN